MDLFSFFTFHGYAKRELVVGSNSVQFLIRNIKRNICLISELIKSIRIMDFNPIDDNSRYISELSVCLGYQLATLVNGRSRI